MEDLTPPPRLIRLRYRGLCRICQVDLPSGTRAFYDQASKQVECAHHDGQKNTPPPETSVIVPNAAEPPADAGVPGASARREFERRAQRRQDRIHAKHPRLGGMILALSSNPQSTTAWRAGAQGEERLGAHLDALRSERLLVLHDRRIPRKRSNIDHIAVTANGVWVIDAKKYQGRPSLKVEGGLLRSRSEKLVVGRRDCTKLIEGVLRQVDVVEDVVLPGRRPEGPGRPWGRVPVRGALCFVEADWPLLARPFHSQGIDVLWPRKLLERLHDDGPLSPESIAEIHRLLAAALPPA